jgi:hypothetical protein
MQARGDQMSLRKNLYYAKKLPKVNNHPKGENLPNLGSML